MTRVLVELARDIPPLARAEAVAAAEALGGHPATSDPLTDRSDLVALELPDPGDAARLAARLALGRRCLIRRSNLSDVRSFFEEDRPGARTASVRRLGRPSSGDSDREVLAVGRAYVDAGGRIDLDRPDRRFWLLDEPGAGPTIFEEIGSVDGSELTRRRMPTLPFQRPVSLPPRLARAAANLAAIRPGDRVLDPFVGTGSLLAEAGLLGAVVNGIDRDAEMIRGALRNLEHLGVSPESLVVGDAGDQSLDVAPGPLDAILTDPPYGRSSSTGGEEGPALVARVLARWAGRVRPGGRIVVVLGDGSDPLGPEWVRLAAIPARVHRSLTRVFRVYQRPGATTSSG